MQYTFDRVRIIQHYSFHTQNTIVLPCSDCYIYIYIYTWAYVYYYIWAYVYSSFYSLQLHIVLSQNWLLSKLLLWNYLKKNNNRRMKIVITNCRFTIAFIAFNNFVSTNERTNVQWSGHQIRFEQTIFHCNFIVISIDSLELSIALSTRLFGVSFFSCSVVAIESNWHFTHISKLFLSKPMNWKKNRRFFVFKWKPN